MVEEMLKLAKPFHNNPGADVKMALIIFTYKFPFRLGYSNKNKSY